jgi:hypothetical protein
VGRLENIIARNRRDGRPRERVVVSLLFGGIVLLILGLMVFTDLGKPPEPPRDDATAPATAPAGKRGPHVDGVLLRRSHAPAPAKH